MLGQVVSPPVSRLAGLQQAREATGGEGGAGLTRTPRLPGQVVDDLVRADGEQTGRAGQTLCRADLSYSSDGRAAGAGVSPWRSPGRRRRGGRGRGRAGDRRTGSGSCGDTRSGSGIYTGSTTVQCSARQSRGLHCTLLPVCTGGPLSGGSVVLVVVLMVVVLLVLVEVVVVDVLVVLVVVVTVVDVVDVEVVVDVVRVVVEVVVTVVAVIVVEVVVAGGGGGAVGGALVIFTDFNTWGLICMSTKYGKLYEYR